jgi:hypothetical protein
MMSKYDSKCAVCREKVFKGTKIWWSSKDKYVVHFGCLEDKLPRTAGARGIDRGKLFYGK